MHVSNRYLDLEPVVVNLARHFNYRLAIVDYDEDEASSEDEEEGGSPWWVYSSTWILLTRNAALLDSPAIRQVRSAARTNTASIPLWTDDFASLFQVLQ